MRRLAVALLALGAPLALANAHAAAAAVRNTSTAIVVSPTSTSVGGAVTMTATVTADPSQFVGVPGPINPTGYVKFWSSQNGGQPVQVGPLAGVYLQPVPGSPNVSQATLTTTSFTAGTFAVSASYLSAEPLLFDNSTSPGTLLQVGGVVIHNTQTALAASPQEVVTGQPETLTATVSTVDGSGIVPTGNVIFDDNGVPLGDPAPLANGVATITVGGFVAGRHVITASYMGDVIDRASSATISLDATGAQSVFATTTTLAVTPSMISDTQTATLTAHVVQTGTNSAPIGNNVVIFTRADATTAGVFVAQAALDANGWATVQVSGWAPGHYVITASYIGNSFSRRSEDTAPLSVLPTGALARTTLTAADAAGDYDDQVTLSASLVDADGPVGGQTITFTAGSETCTAVTGADGAASCTATLADPAGTYPIVVSFAGTRDLAAATNGDGATLTVTPEEAQLSVAAHAAGATTTLAATLLEDGTAPVAGRLVTLSLGGAACTALTAADGTASCTVATPAGTSATLTGTFGGDDRYATATASTLVQLQVPTRLVYGGATTADYDDQATLSATLTDAGGAPVAGATVALSMGAQTCSSRTDATGVAACTITVAQPAGAYSATASFAGSGADLPSSTIAPFVVTHEQVSVSAGTGGAIASAGTLQLTATLVEDGTTPVPGRTLTLTLGAASCTGTTDASGVASCTVAPPALGPTTSSAVFAGDDRYVAASASRPALLYAYAPGGGSFVVGDRTAVGAVTFWGAQWWQANLLSSTPASSSFKGFAVVPGTPACGGTWSTDPGNSAPPPAGPLPAYMAVIATSSAVKTGAAISGDTVHVVILKTGAGYDGNPGHAGTGAVVATVC